MNNKIAIKINQFSEVLMRSSAYKKAVIKILRKYTPTRRTTRWKVKPKAGNYYGINKAEMRRGWGIDRNPGELARSWEVSSSGNSISFSNTAPYAKPAFEGFRMGGGFVKPILRNVGAQRIKPLEALDDGASRRLKGTRAITSLKNRVVRFTSEVIKTNSYVLRKFFTDEAFRDMIAEFVKNVKAQPRQSLIKITAKQVNISERFERVTQVVNRLTIPAYKSTWR